MNVMKIRWELPHWLWLKIFDACIHLWVFPCFNLIEKMTCSKDDPESHTVQATLILDWGFTLPVENTQESYAVSIPNKIKLKIYNNILVG